ncbi:MAG: T9SS type A sorting domain-containing protein [Vicingus serpentipes]|nr:T9SS type A sorting domain-containing protein [Vicingus serpentipes]
MNTPSLSPLFYSHNSVVLRIIVAIIFLITYHISNAQCTTCPSDCSSGCTVTYSSSSSTDFASSSNGDKLCITGGTYTGNIDFDDDNVVVCVSGTAIFNPGYIDAALGDGGTIQIGPSASATLPAISFGSSRYLTIDNCGSITHSGAMTRTGSGNFFYNNNGTVDFGANAVDFNGTATDNAICNDGSWTSGDIDISGDLTNSDSMWVSNIDVDRTLTNETNGYIEATGTISVTVGATLNQKGIIYAPTGTLDFSGSTFNVYDGSLTTVDDFTASGNGSITGVTDCGAIKVISTSSFTGSVLLTGNVDFCDNSGVAPTRAGTTMDPKVDSYSGTNVPFGGSVTYCTCDALTLPIELLSFSAYERDNKVQLEWNTITEINNNYFTIYKSKDAINWEEVVKVTGAGNSSQIRHYTSVDQKPYFGTSYYRLKQTDFDGRFEYFPIVTINIANKEIVTVYPNPAKNSITIMGNSLELKDIVLANYLGQDLTHSIQISKENNNRKQIDVSSLSSGIYFLKTKTTINKIFKE